MLFIERIVCRRPRAVRSRGVRWRLVRVLRERAIYATDAGAVGRAHATAQRVAYTNSNGRTLAAAIVNAHVRPIALADGAADAKSNGPTDSDADRLSDACAEPSAEFTEMRIFIK